MNKFYLILFLFLFVFGCAAKPSGGYKTIQNKARKDPVDQGHIDTTGLIERNYDEAVGEFKGSQWLIAVHSDRTGYTYFYDKNNKLLGKRREFAGNPRKDLIQKQLRVE